jgi:hypothetical protein
MSGNMFIKGKSLNDQILVLQKELLISKIKTEKEKQKTEEIHQELLNFKVETELKVQKIQKMKKLLMKTKLCLKNILLDDKIKGKYTLILKEVGK